MGFSEKQREILKFPYTKYDATIRFRCTENQRNIIEMLASREGKTISDFIRDRCLKY